MDPFTCDNPECVTKRQQIKDLQRRIDGLTGLLKAQGIYYEQYTTKPSLNNDVTGSVHAETSTSHASSSMSSSVCINDFKTTRSSETSQEKDVQHFMDSYFLALFDTTNDISQPIEEEKFEQLCQAGAGRLACARALNNRRGFRMACDDKLFSKLVTCMKFVLDLCDKHMDYTPAKTLMNMAFTFYRCGPKMKDSTSSPVKKEYISTQLRDLGIWQNALFWETSFFQAVEHAQSYIEDDLFHALPTSDICTDDKDMTSGMDAKYAITEQQRCDVNTMFAQLGTFIQNMVELGVKRQICHSFLEKMGAFSGLDEEQLDLLHDCLADAVQPEQRTVTLYKDAQYGFGLVLKGRQYTADDGHMVSYIRISSIRTGSPADQSGDIHPGDRLVGINDIQFTSSTRTEQVRLLLSSMDSAKFVVESALSRF